MRTDSPPPSGTRVERVWSAVGPLLVPLSWPYAAVVAARRRWWRGRGRPLGRPVISVGNITCGGTGKTPTVEMVVRDLLDLGRRPAILSRGYGANPQRGLPQSDEYHVLAANLPGVPHYQGADRLRSGRRAVGEGADVLVLDDGFQHVRLRRDLDLVLVDALDPFGRGRLLPAGLLREPIGALRHAQLLGITRVDLEEDSRVEALSDYLTGRFPELPQVRLAARAQGWFALDGSGSSVGRDDLKNRDVLAFCGIGNPEAFRRQLLREGLRLKEWLPFTDHHRYTRRDVERIARRARELAVGAVVTTQKDAVKLIGPHVPAAAEPPWLYLKIVQTIRSGDEAYRTALARLVDERD